MSCSSSKPADYGARTPLRRRAGGAEAQQVLIPTCVTVPACPCTPQREKLADNRRLSRAQNLGPVTERRPSSPGLGWPARRPASLPLPSAPRPAARPAEGPFPSPGKVARRPRGEGRGRAALPRCVAEIFI